jgi:hypothetical protein
MTTTEYLAHKWCIGICIATATVAAVATRLAADYQAAWSTLNALVQAVPFIPARYWAQESDFPDLTAIYFALCWPVLPATFGAIVTRYWTLDDIDRPAAGFELKAGFGGLLLIALGIGSLWEMDGGEMMGMPIGLHLSQLVVLGWTRFALAGGLTGFGIVALRRVFDLSAH